MDECQRRIQIHEADIPEGLPLLDEDVFWLDVAPGSLIEEGEGKAKKLFLDGKIGITGKPTANRRVYPREIISRNFARLGEALNEGMVYGELGHPKDGKTDFSRVSHLVRKLWLEDNGDQHGRFELIPGTTNGDQAIAIARVGGKLGVSSRGFGTTAPDGKGNDVVQEDYQLVTFDIVADPAAANAHPNQVWEQKENHSMTMDLDTLKEEHSELVESLQAEFKEQNEADARDHAREALRTEFEEQLAEKADEIREEAVGQARSNLLEDPAVAGAKTAMDRIKEVVAPFVVTEDENSLVKELQEKVAEKDRQIAQLDEDVRQLNEENEELAGISKELGHHLYLERELEGNDRAQQIIEMLGDVKEYEDLDELAERVEEVSSALSEEDEAKAEYEQRIAALEKEKVKLAEERDQALSIGNQFGIRAYVERKIGNHSQQVDLREHLNEAKPKTKEDVDRLVESFTKKNPPSKEFLRLRDGIEQHQARSNKELELVTEDVEESGAGNQILGVPVDEVIKRSNAMS